MTRTVGVLTGGGDCPGLNAVIRAVARRSFDRGDRVVGVREGWRGLIEVVGVPKTIDNDLSATDYTFGFDTAVSIAT